MVISFIWFLNGIHTIQEIIPEGITLIVKPLPNEIEYRFFLGINLSILILFFTIIYFIYFN